MKMDYSITRQLSSQIPDHRVSTNEIKAGLERIKKAQEQVLQELKRTHPDQSIDLTNQARPHHNLPDHEGLRRELTLQREKSTEKSTLYRRRVVDLEASLTQHEENQRKLRMENKGLEDHLRALRTHNSDLERDYEKLVQQCETSNRNVRNLEKQVMQLVKKLQQQDPQKLRIEFQQINAERNSIMTEKVALLKTNSKLESENIELKTKLSQMATQMAESKEKILSKLKQPQDQVEYRLSDLKAILNQIQKMNTSHEAIFASIKSNTKLSRALIEKENSYQNSLNKVLAMYNTIQKGAIVDSGVIEYKFDQADQEQYVREEVQKVEGELMKKHKKQLGRYISEKQQLQNKIRIKDSRIQQLEKECEQKEEKITRLRKQKSSLMQQIGDANMQIDRIKQNAQKQDSKRMEEELRKQKNKDEEYRIIIQELNEQMLTIQKQKKDLDGLIGKMTNNKSEEELKNKKKLNEIVDVNQKIREENEKIKEKYQAIFVEKQHLYLSFNQCQNKNNNLNKELAREILQKQKLIAELNKLKQDYEIGSAEVHKFKLLTQNTKKDCDNLNNSYLLQIERLIQESLQLRQQIEILLKDRNELRDLKSKYGLLMKDNQILGKRARNLNNHVDHLWSIKQVQYQNINKIVSELRPL